MHEDRETLDPPPPFPLARYPIRPPGFTTVQPFVTSDTAGLLSVCRGWT